jgi:2,4-dienoyl-CoA reductase-like NADH-dependent reductase (Old Yellow Enzyme family)
MGGDANPFESFGYITRAVVRQYPSLGYVHFVEPLDWTADWRTNYTASFSADGFAEGVRPSNDYFRAIVRGIDPETLPKDLNSTVFPEPDEKHSTLFLSASESLDNQLSFSSHAHCRLPPPASYLLVAGGFKGESAISHSERTGDVVVFGRYFISTPDLVDRIKTGKEFNQYDRNVSIILLFAWLWLHTLSCRPY